jgi:tetratricopeptide (TPR) repeat protein
MGWLACLLALCTAASAAAGGYDEFGAGIDANNRGAPAVAAVHFSRALAAGDLADSYMPAAFLGRARAELRQNDCAAAKRDLDAALRLKPAFADAYSLRAETRACLGEDAAALADADAAVGLKPAAGYLFVRSRLYWNRGAFREAHTDAEAAAARDPGNAYFRLWSAVAAMALDRTPTRSDATLTTIGDWPGPLLDLFGGRSTPDAVWRAAANDKGRACEADFYVGAWHQSRGERVAARNLYARAADRCPTDFVAFDAARRALKRLD